MKIHPSIDDNLYEIMKKHCKCNNIGFGNFIAVAIADKLQIRLNEDYCVPHEIYVEMQIREIDNCIDKLEKEKEKLKGVI